MLVTRNFVIISVGVLLLFISLILYIVLGLTVIQSYASESIYKKTTCTVRAVDIHKLNDKDDWYRCPWHCTVNHTPDGLKTTCEISEFPCLRVVVDVATKHGLKTAILHENPEKMSRYLDCSTYYCDRDSIVNDKLVNKFKRNYGQLGQKYSCFYNVDSLTSDDYDDDGQEHALLRLTYNQASYINSLFWPSLCAFVGIVLIFYGMFKVYEAKRYKRLNKDRRAFNDNL
jgi:hypothetical protein